MRLRNDDVLRQRLGRNARRWVEENAALDRWAGRLAEAVIGSAGSLPEDQAAHLAGPSVIGA